MRSEVRLLLLAGMLSTAVTIGLGRFAFTPLLPLMQAESGFGATVAGWLGSANHVGYLAGALWAAFVSDIVTKRRLILSGLVLGQICLAAMAATDSLWLWGLLRLLSGLSSGWVFVLGSTLIIARLAASGEGRLAGWHFGGIGIGIAFSGSLVGLTGPLLGAGGEWLALSLAGSLVVIAIWPVLSTLPAPAPAAPPRVAEAETGLPRLALSYFCEGLGYIVTGTFLVTLAKASPALAPMADFAWVAVGVAALPSTVLWGWWAERRGYRRAIVAAHLVQAVGIALPALFDHPAAVLVSGLLFGSTFLGIVGMVLAYGRQMAGAKLARTTGLLSVAFGLGQIIGPSAAGAIADWGGWSPALLFAAGIVLAGVPPLMIRANRRDECLTSTSRSPARG